MTPLPFSTFSGFAPGRPRTITLPTAFFTDLLPLIDDVNELKLTLFAFYAIQQREGRYRYLRHTELLINEALHGVFGGSCEAAFIEALITRTCARGTLLCAEIELFALSERLYFINAEPGRLALEQIARGQWQLGIDSYPVEILPERPTLYQLYEENIGPLTPIIADILREAEGEFPRGWIEDAIKAAVERNARSWRFVHAVLTRRQQEGKHHDGDGNTRRGDQTDGSRYITGKYADFVEY